MEETIIPDPAYLKGFNEGYLIAQHLPELSSKLQEAIAETSSLRGSGFKDGRAKFLEETFEKSLPAFLKNNPLQTTTTKTTDKNTDKKKGLEPDI